MRRLKDVADPEVLDRRARETLQNPVGSGGRIGVTMLPGFDACGASRDLKCRSRGYAFRNRCFFWRRRVRVGSGLVLGGEFVVRGPGRVVIGIVFG